MITLTLNEVAQILNLNSSSENALFQGVSIDTRTLTKGNLFIALPGEKVDGNQFLADALQKGAAAALVSKYHTDISLPQMVVNDPVAALGILSQEWRNRFTLPFVAVTGSNGKTTLKNMIASILRAACHAHPEHVLATDGNFNNHIGLPLTLCRLNSSHRYGVIEMGMNHPGEIAYLTQLVKPEVAVLNNAAAAHLEGLGDVAGVARAKAEIFLGLQPNGTAILNRDDAFFDYWKEHISPHRYLTFGLDSPADVTATFSSESIQLKTPQGEIRVTLPLLGRHNVMNALAGTAAAIALNIPLDVIKMGLEQVLPAPGRLRAHRLAHHVTVIDDTYNANPASVTAAIRTLSNMPEKKIFVLGDMKELGENAVKLHAEIGQTAREAGIDYLFTFGELSRAATEQFGKNAFHFTERETLIAALKPHVTESVSVLVKGSRSMRMEKILAALLPENNEIVSH